MSDFTGITYKNRHSSEFNLVRVSGGDRYEENLIPSFQNYTTEKVGGNGSYYWGASDKEKIFELHFAFDNLKEIDIRNIKTWLAGEELGWLIFDEIPYKKYLCKLSSAPSFKTVCFEENSVRVYKGELDFSLISYSPYGRDNGKGLDQYRKYKPVLDEKGNPVVKEMIWNSDGTLTALNGNSDIDSSKWYSIKAIANNSTEYTEIDNFWDWNKITRKNIATRKNTNGEVEEYFYIEGSQDANMSLEAALTTFPIYQECSLPANGKQRPVLHLSFKAQIDVDTIIDNTLKKYNYSKDAIVTHNFNPCGIYYSNIYSGSNSLNVWYYNAVPIWDWNMLNDTEYNNFITGNVITVDIPVCGSDIQYINWTKDSDSIFTTIKDDINTNLINNIIPTEVYFSNAPGFIYSADSLGNNLPTETIYSKVKYWDFSLKYKIYENNNGTLNIKEDTNHEYNTIPSAGLSNYYKEKIYQVNSRSYLETFLVKDISVSYNTTIEGRSVENNLIIPYNFNLQKGAKYNIETGIIEEKEAKAILSGLDSLSVASLIEGYKEDGKKVTLTSLDNSILVIIDNNNLINDIQNAQVDILHYFDSSKSYEILMKHGEITKCKFSSVLVGDKYVFALQLPKGIIDGKDKIKFVHDWANSALDTASNYCNYVMFYNEEDVLQKEENKKYSPYYFSGNNLKLKNFAPFSSMRIYLNEFEEENNDNIDEWASASFLPEHFESNYELSGNDLILKNYGEVTTYPVYKIERKYGEFFTIEINSKKQHFNINLTSSDDVNIFNSNFRQAFMSSGYIIIDMENQIVSYQPLLDSHNKPFETEIEAFSIYELIKEGNFFGIEPLKEVKYTINGSFYKTNNGAPIGTNGGDGSKMNEVSFGDRIKDISYDYLYY